MGGHKRELGAWMLGVHRMLLGATLAAMAFAGGGRAAEPPSQPAAGQAEGDGFTLVGGDDLQGRPAYQPTIHQQNGRWIAYIGHHGGKEVNPATGQEEWNGTSIVDVTDPAHPRYLRHIPGEPGQGETGGGQMVRVCDGKTLPKGDPSKTYMLRTFGNAAHEIWDVSDPAAPSLLARLEGLKGTHKNWWECDSGIAYLVSGLPGWRVRRMTQIYDLSDPAHPKFIRNFGLAGQQPGASGEAPMELHGAVSTGPEGNRVYFGYGTDKGGVLQIVDRKKLLTGPPEPTPATLQAPEIGRFNLAPWNGAHTVFPVLGVAVPDFANDKQGAVRDFVVITDEELAEKCAEPRQMVWFVDITSETRPVSVATFQVPEASGHFCQRGGRFGSHASNENFGPPYYGKVMFFSWFNAGVRAVDIRDPFHPRQIAWYIPAVTDRTKPTCVKGSKTDCARVIQTNNVDTDQRGLVYIVDRAGTGLHILALTEAVRRSVLE